MQTSLIYCSYYLLSRVDTFLSVITPILQIIPYQISIKCKYNISPRRYFDASLHFQSICEGNLDKILNDQQIYTKTTLENKHKQPVARVPTAFLILPNFHSCFCNSIETWYMLFYFLKIVQSRFLCVIVDLHSILINYHLMELLST